MAYNRSPEVRLADFDKTWQVHPNYLDINCDKIFSDLAIYFRFYSAILDFFYNSVYIFKFASPKIDNFVDIFLKTLFFPYRMLICLTSFTVFFSGDIKKSSVNDQLTGHFRAFLFILFRPPTLNLKKEIPLIN